MSLDVAIVVAGLILSVRGSGGVTFVLPNAEHASHPPHYSILGVPAHAIKSQTGGTPVPPDNPEYYFWNVSGCRMQPPALTPPVLSPNNPTLKPEAGVTTSNLGSLARLPSLWALSLAPLKDELWSDGATIGTKSSAVSAVARFSGGRLEVKKLVPRLGGGSMPFQFFDDDGKEPVDNPFRALAQQLLYHGEASNTSWPLLQACGTLDVILDKSTTENYPILLLNVPESSGASSHFTVFYDLLDDYKGPRYCPIPLSQALRARTRAKSKSTGGQSLPMVLLEQIVRIFGPTHKSKYSSPSDPFCPGSQWP